MKPTDEPAAQPPPEPSVDAAPMSERETALRIALAGHVCGCQKADCPKVAAIVPLAVDAAPAVALKEGAAPAIQDAAFRRKAGLWALLLQKLDLFIDFSQGLEACPHQAGENPCCFGVTDPTAINAVFRDVTEALADIRRRGPLPAEQQSQAPAAPVAAEKLLDEKGDG